MVLGLEDFKPATCPKCDEDTIMALGHGFVKRPDGIYEVAYMICQSCKHEWTNEKKQKGKA